MNLLPLIGGLRQWMFPAQFRIDAAEPNEWSGAVVALVAGALADVKAARSAVKRAEKAAQEARQTAAGKTPSDDAQPGAIPADFAIALCNQCFSLARRLNRMGEDAGASKEVRRLKRALEEMDKLLDEHQIKWIDLTGQPWDERRTDFKSIAKAQVVPGLSGKVIERCECPVVLVGGVIAQKARGIVARPA